MQLFGASVVPLRWSLAVCNAMVSVLLFPLLALQLRGRRVERTPTAASREGS